MNEWIKKKEMFRNKLYKSKGPICKILKHWGHNVNLMIWKFENAVKLFFANK